jgi:hypothetical protein
MNSNPDFPPYQKIRRLSSTEPEPKRPALPVRQPNTSKWDIRTPRPSWGVLRPGRRRVIPLSKRNKTQMSLRGRIDRGNPTQSVILSPSLTVTLSEAKSLISWLRMTASQSVPSLCSGQGFVSLAMTLFFYFYFNRKLIIPSRPPLEKSVRLETEGGGGI